MSLNVGIIGFGRIGAEHAGWLAVAKGIKAIAVSDPTPARRAIAETSGLKTHSDIQTLLDEKSIDAVLVATPSAMHFEHVTLALSAGKHVMVEKPMALDLPQAGQMVAEAEKRALVLSVFHNRRWDIDYLTVKSAIEAGVFGRIINIESRICQWASCVGPAAPQWRPNWRNEAVFGGGGLYDWGSHLIDQMWRLMLPAKPRRIFAQLRGNVWTRDCDDFARVCVDFDNGAVGLVEINTTTTRPMPRWRIDGTQGSAEAPSSPKYDTNDWAKLDFTPADGTALRRLPLAPSRFNEPEIWTRFGASIRREGQPAVPAKGVLPTMCLLDAARKSSRDGIAVDPGEFPNDLWIS